MGFVCNICGSPNETMPGENDREVPSCGKCGSTIRTRSLMQVLSEELFGVTIPVCDFPRLKGIRGIGTSDSDDYASLLSDRFDYKNTWYHREPKFDVAEISEADKRQYDFVITSEVLEHVAPPVERAFTNLFRLLKPDGVLVMTVPFVQTEATAEHFPALHDYAIAALKDRLVLVNRTQEGTIEVHQDLVFHGGPGSTLELRLFSEKHLRQCLTKAGFSEVQFYPGPSLEWGILHPGLWSLPLAARKQPFVVKRSCVADWAMQWHALLTRTRKHEEEMSSVQASKATLDQELLIRTEWAQRLDRELAESSERLLTLQREFGERTAWAQSLDREVTERTERALALQRELEEARASIAALQTGAENLRRERDEARRTWSSRVARVVRRLRG